MARVGTYRGANANAPDINLDSAYTVNSAGTGVAPVPGPPIRDTPPSSGVPNPNPPPVNPPPVTTTPTYPNIPGIPGTGWVKPVLDKLFDSPAWSQVAERFVNRAATSAPMLSPLGNFGQNDWGPTQRQQPSLTRFLNGL